MRNTVRNKSRTTSAVLPLIRRISNILQLLKEIETMSSVDDNDETDQPVATSVPDTGHVRGAGRLQRRTGDVHPLGEQGDDRFRDPYIN